jgi:uncharacterized protein HemX
MSDCDNCETRKEQKTVLARLNKMSGGNTVRNWLLGVVVAAALGGGYFNVAAADSLSKLITRVALTEQAIEEMKKNAAEEKKHREQHRSQHKEDKQEILDKQDEILEAVRRR